MAQDKASTFKQLTALLDNPRTLTLPLSGGPYVIMSDLHLGNGSKADDFRDNEKAVVEALTFYQANNYTLILLGDVEELWQFDLDQIKARYFKTVYNAMRAFEDRLYRVFGNHDSEWNLPPDPARKNARRRGGAHESVNLVDEQGAIKVVLVHGHQGNVTSDKYSWFSRFVVRGLFKPIEPAARFLGVYGHPSATKSQVTTDYEQVLYTWARDAKKLLICGHSHRAIFASKSYAQLLQDQIAELQIDNLQHREDRDQLEANIKKIQTLQDKVLRERQRGRDIDPSGTTRPLPCYFNTGCALYDDGATVIELAEGTIRLVKWSRSKLERTVYQQNDLAAFIQQVEQA